MQLRLKELLRDRNMTALQLANETGKSHVGIVNLCNNKSNPSADMLEVLAKTLKVEIWELFVKSTDSRSFMALIKDGDNNYSATSLEELEAIVKSIKLDQWNTDNRNKMNNRQKEG